MGIGQGVLILDFERLEVLGTVTMISLQVTMNSWFWVAENPLAKKNLSCIVSVCLLMVAINGCIPQSIAS